MFTDGDWLSFEQLLLDRFSEDCRPYVVKSAVGEALWAYLALQSAGAVGSERRTRLVQLAEQLRNDGRFGLAAPIFAAVREETEAGSQLWIALVGAEASVWVAAKRFDQALECYRMLRSVRPEDASVAESLMQVLRRAGRGEESLEVALAEFERIGNTPWTSHAMGLSLLKVGETRAAVEFLREAAQKSLWQGNSLSSYVFSLSYLGSSAIDAWKEMFATVGTECPGISVPDQEDTIVAGRSPLRRIRVAYVSGDFARNPLARFFLPLVRSHHPDLFEVTGYSCRVSADAVTLEISRCCDHWFSVHDWSDDRLSDHIRGLQVDILIDLGGWSSGGRPSLFKRRSAPIQMTMLGMMQDTGFPCLDYRLGDAWLDPDDGPFIRGHEVERLLRHPLGAVSYLPPNEAGSCEWQGSVTVTFGVVAQLEKVSRDVARVWARVLGRVEDSRILVLGDAGHRLRSWLLEDGVEAWRIECRGRLPGIEYFSALREMDVVLDSFPFTGLTVTLDAAWMGVPTVTLAGRLPFERGGLLVAERLGRPHFVAQTVDAFVEIAVRTIVDIGGLRQGRADLRKSVLGAFGDSVAWTHAFERMLCDLVARHCEVQVESACLEDHERRRRDRLWENGLSAGIVSPPAAIRVATALESAGLSDGAGRVLEEALQRYRSTEVVLQWCEWRLRRGGVDDVLLSRLEDLSGQGSLRVCRLQAEVCYRRFGAVSALEFVRQSSTMRGEAEFCDFLRMAEWGWEAGETQFVIECVSAALKQGMSLQLLSLLRRMILAGGRVAVGVFQRVIDASQWLGLETATASQHE
jgi:predicted O-linked N-acetylglucosamine transferase (SPINDLY family)